MLYNVFEKLKWNFNFFLKQIVETVLNCSEKCAEMSQLYVLKAFIEKTEKWVLICQPTLPLFSVPWFVFVFFWQNHIGEKVDH